MARTPPPVKLIPGQRVLTNHAQGVGGRLTLATSWRPALIGPGGASTLGIPPAPTRCGKQGVRVGAEVGAGVTIVKFASLIPVTVLKAASIRSTVTICPGSARSQRRMVGRAPGRGR